VNWLRFRAGTLAIGRESPLGEAPNRRGTFGRSLAVLALLVALRCEGATTWTRLQAQNFTILSALSESETRSWAVEFEQFHRGLGKVLNLNEAALQPVTVVLFSSDKEMNAYKPLENGRPAKVAGLFVRCGLGNFIEASSYFEDEQTRMVIYHESVHWLTIVSATPLPLWLCEGLAETFSTFKINGTISRYGDPLPRHIARLNREKMLPLKELLNIQQGSLLYNEGERTNIFYAESWAFVHYLLLGRKAAERSKFNDLINALRPGSDPDAVFIKVFGVDCAAMDRRLAQYLRGGEYISRELKFDPKEVAQAFTVRPATQTEVDLTLSCLMSAVGRPEEAMPRLDRIVEALPNNPVAWEARGFAAYQDHDYGEAMDCFRKAEARGSRNYFVYAFLGDLALGLDPGATTQTMLNGSGRAAADYYEKDLALNPADQHAYDNIALNIYPIDTLTGGDIRTLEEGTQKFPNDPEIKVGLAAAALKKGLTAIALTALHAIAEDRSPDHALAASCAQGILENRQGKEIADRMNALIQKEDYDGIESYADELLKSPLNPEFQEQVIRQRDWARVAAKVRRATELVNKGQVDEGRKLLEEADAENKEPRTHQQIQDILEEIAGRTSP
jgi:tetratricopeptide (TPR) repeat protein